MKWCLLTLLLILVIIRGDIADWAGESLVDDLYRASNESDVLDKRQFNSRTRLLFVAGLEGTGHHAWGAMFNVCVQAVKCEVASELTVDLMNFDPSKNNVQGLFGAADTRVNSLQLTKAYKHMKQLALGNQEQLFFLGLCFVKRSAMLSYPNYNGEHKSLDHPDIFTLASLAELAGLDFRIIVLQRSARDIIASTGRRGIGGWHEPKILLDNAASLYAQLALLDRQFYRCVDYDEVGRMNAMQKKALGHFMHPTRVAPIIEDMVSEIKYSGKNTRNMPIFGPNMHLFNATKEKWLSPVNQTLHDRKDQKNRWYREPSDPRVDLQSTRYHIWQLESRLKLINELCSKS